MSLNLFVPPFKLLIIMSIDIKIIEETLKRANEIMDWHVDPLSKEPAYKMLKASIRKFPY